jgi:hypothetical protein
MSFEKIRRLRVSLDKIFRSDPPLEEIKNQDPVTVNNREIPMGLIKPKLISYYADFDTNKYYEGFAKILTEKWKSFGLDYDISELESRGNYGVNCLMKPEFILEKITKYKKPLIWMDCDTDFREPFDHFNNITEDVGMATHSGELNGIKASPLYFNYTKGAFRIIREWVVHCRACYDKGIVELDHDALKHYVLDAIKGSYSTYLLTDNWNDFVHGRYIWNGNSKVEGKIQIHRKVGVSDEIRRAYSQDVKFIKVIFESKNSKVFKSALNFLEGFSNRFRFNFIFSETLFDESVDNDDFARLEIESGGLVYFNELNFDSIHAGKGEIIVGVNNVKSIENEWDLKIVSTVDCEENPLYSLNFDDDGKGGIKIKTNKKLWI